MARMGCNDQDPAGPGASSSGRPGEQAASSEPSHHGDAGHGERHPHLHHALETLRGAALDAEYRTGVHEETVEEARRSITRRLARMTSGFAVLGLGVALVPLPGPGLVVVAAGLAILARDFTWAERTLVNIERRLPRGTDGRIPRRVIVVGVGVGLAGFATSIWWSFLR